jgi:hypothetical protein
MCLNHWSRKENGGPRLQLKMVLALVQLLALLVLNKLKGSQSCAHGFQQGPLLSMPSMQSRSLGPPQCDFQGEAAEIRYCRFSILASRIERVRLSASGITLLLRRAWCSQLPSLEMTGEARVYGCTFQKSTKKRRERKVKKNWRWRSDHRIWKVIFRKKLELVWPGELVVLSAIFI